MKGASRWGSDPPIVTRRWLMGLVLGLASLFPVPLSVTDGAQPAGEADGPLRGTQGAVVVVRVPIQDRPDRVTGTFLKRTVTFFPVKEQVYAGLLGLDMQDPPGPHELTLEVVYPQRTDHRRLSVLVRRKAYPEQRVTLPQHMVDLDRDTLARVKAEAQVLHHAFEHVVPYPLWKGEFLEPVQGHVSGRFGSRRVINGHPRQPHSGEDIAAPEGTPVAAMNEGIVRLTLNHFFTGHGVIVDHGLGLFSMYFHLSGVVVEQDQAVTKGQVIGYVGATGRATGPHLHWGVRLNGARVDPYALLALPFDTLF